MSDLTNDNANNSKAGLYFHIPFCIQKCNYCDFYSITKVDEIDKFIDYLIKELDIFSKNNNDIISVDTIFFGGGTPSLLKHRHLERIFHMINSIFDIDPNSEITLEANPGAIDVAHLLEFKDIGINRISFGVQSFNENDLKFLKRIHTTQEAIKSIEYASKIGYDNISIDLIYGLPNQTLSSWKTNFDILKNLEISHLSAYNLIYEDNTPLHQQLTRGEIIPLEEKTEEYMYLAIIDFLEEVGLHQYELSNFAKQGFECKHNIKYWTHIPYFGFGPSSHSYNNKRRFWNYRKVHNYYRAIDQNQLPIEDLEVIDNYKFIIEKIMLGLRYDGLSINFISDIIKEDIGYFIEHDIIPIKKSFQEISDTFRLSKSGFFMLNEIALKFINQIDLKKI